MATYVLLYRGGSMPETEAEQAAAMQAWEGWLGGLGEAVVDPGNPFGPSTHVAADGSVGGTTAGGSGYSILTAGSLDVATIHAKDCPVLAGGGSIDVYETFEVM